MNRKFLEKRKKQELLQIANGYSIKTPKNIQKANLIALLLANKKLISEKKSSENQPHTTHKKTYSSRLAKDPKKITHHKHKARENESDCSKIILMVTNPYNAYTYWHLTQDSITKGYALFDEKREDVEEIVRVIDISTTPSKKNVFFCDTKVRFANGDTWLPLGVPDKEFVVEIGLLSKSDEFLPLAISNSVKTPRDKVSESHEERWMNPNRKENPVFLTTELAQDKTLAQSFVHHTEAKFLNKLLTTDEKSVSNAIYKALKFDQFGESFLKEIVSSMGSS